MLAGRRWTVDLCQTDSDGDGLTNGQELGDPHCVWQPGEAPARAHNISHPGMDEASMRRFVEKKRSRGDGWSSAGLSQDPFTWILFYYQFVVIPILLGSAIGASCAARQLTSWRRHGAARFPSLLGIFAAYWLIFIVGVGCGVHRYFSHKSYTATRPWKLFLAWLSLLVGQGGPLDWAYVHRIHHRLCDDELDYHSPLNADVSHSVGLFGLKGFIYAHATWLVTPHKHVRRSPKLESHLVPDIVHDPDLLWFNDFVAHNPLLSKGIVGWILPGVTLGLLYLCTANNAA
jgi:fatty-acid desaturase